MLRLQTEFEVAVVSSLSVVIELSPEGLVEFFEAGVVLLSDVLQANTGCGLLSDKGSELGLALDDAVGDSLFSAELRKPDDQLDGSDIGSNDNELGLVVLNQVSDVVQSVFESDWLGSGVWLLALFFVGGQSLESGLLLGLAFWVVLLQNSEQVLGCSFKQLGRFLGMGQREREQMSKRASTSFGGGSL